MAPHLRKDPWSTAWRPSRYVSSIPSIFHWHVHDQFPFFSATLSKERSRRKCTCWTRTSFMSSTTFSGIWDSKPRPRPKRYNDVSIISIKRIISIISIIRIMYIKSIILIISIICRFAWNLELRITCGRRRGHWLPKPLITWEISFVQPCVPDGLHTSVVPTQRTILWVPAPSWGKPSWCSPIESNLLLAATSNDPPWWMMQSACFLQWIPTQIA